MTRKSGNLIRIGSRVETGYQRASSIMNIWTLRAVILSLVFLLVGAWVVHYGIKERSQHRFQALWLSNGLLSAVQQEAWYEKDRGIRAGDRMLKVEGVPFQARDFKQLLQKKSPRSLLNVQYRDPEGVLRETELLVRHYNRSSFILLFVLPSVLGLIFFLLAVSIPLQTQRVQRWREPVEVFSAICLFLSFFFLGFFPSVTGGLYYPPTAFTPILSALILHLFLVYPKKKLPPKIRMTVLGIVYAVSVGLIVLQIQDWQSFRLGFLSLMNFLFFAICAAGAFLSLINTLLTSKDFWARRRARVLSVILFGIFFLMTSVFFALLWDGLKFSWERVLSVSLIFPAGFALVFLKTNVFDLERIFRRGLHQMVVVLMGICFSLIVGLGLSEWGFLEENPWLTYAAVAIIVLALARPAGDLIERVIHRAIQTRVRYPKVDALLEQSNTLEEFLSAFLQDCEKSLNLQNLKMRFIQDPTRPYAPATDVEKSDKGFRPGGNEQLWKWGPLGLERVSAAEFRKSQYESPILRGGRTLGVFGFDGEDTIAFDPETSRDWQEVMKALSRAIEVLCLREFLVMQQGLMAVGRMQALLAHEMKNPLAIIKVCAGLLATRVAGDEENEELIRTVQQEVNRVTKGLQNIFDHSGRAERQQRVNLRELIDEILESVRTRFPSIPVEAFEREGDRKHPVDDLFCVIEREGLKQSLTNLVVNSLEAGSPWVGIEVSVGGSRLQISVQDRGPGISKEIELFRPFVTSKPGGTGLGLSLVKSFVDRAGGYIRVQTEKGLGTTIRLDLPLGEEGLSRANVS